MEDFKPVILGIDVGAYSLARCIYEHYNIKSIIVGKCSYWMTSYSKITIPIVIDNMNEEILIDRLLKLKDEYKDVKLIIFGCSEDYVDIIVRHKEELSNVFIVPYVDKNILDRVVQKEGFYEVCKEVGINYPETLVVNKDNYMGINVPFNYPVVAKVSNKAKYQRIKFEGKMKVFVAKDEEELKDILNRCYNAGYDDDIVVQKYIKGTDANMRVLTCFCNESSDVVFSSVGRVLLEEKGPEVTGNYSAIVNTIDEKIVSSAKAFLKHVHYVGYANFDIKYDDETGEYYFFEVNVRLGRSNYYMAAGNTNYLAPCIDTFIYHNYKTYEQIGRELYRIVPMYVIKKYVKDKNLYNECKKLKKNNPLDYKKDFNIKRKIYIWMALINHIRKFKKYYE